RRGQVPQDGGERLLGEVVGRVEEDEVEPCGAEPCGVPLRGRRDDADAGEPQRGGVAAGDVGGGSGAVDERDDGGPAARGLEAERAGAGVEVEHARAVEHAEVLEAGEDRLPHAVAGRPGALGGYRDRPPADRPRNDPAHAPDPNPPRRVPDLRPSGTRKAAYIP